MTTSCIAFFSKAGIVAASDSDFSIRPLSKKYPAAIAVNIHSVIPWKNIIDEYILENDSRTFSTLIEFYDSFENFFKGRKIESSMFKKNPEEHFYLMGFNEDDLYPTLIGANIGVDEHNILNISDSFERNVNLEDYAFYAPIGDFNFVSPILAGASDSFMEAVKKNEIKLLTLYKDKLLDKVKGMPKEKEWSDKINSFDINTTVDERMVESMNKVLTQISLGIDTFSIEEMVDYAESLVNAEIRLRNLKQRDLRNSYGTREIAVITIPEGFTWIKHHLFAI